MGERAPIAGRPAAASSVRSRRNLQAAIRFGADVRPSLRRRATSCGRLDICVSCEEP